jgi:hypothetical protein
MTWPRSPALKTLSENHSAKERKKKNEMRMRSEMTGWR